MLCGRGGAARAIARQGGGTTPVDIERFVNWTLMDQKAHMGAPILAPGEQATDYEIGQGGSSPGTYAVHSDAFECYRAICGLNREQFRLVMVHGLGRTRPDWMRAWPEIKIEPLTQARGRGAGKPLVIMDERARRPLYCPVRIYLDPHPETIRARRRDYRLWWAAMQWLAMLFGDNPGWLRRYRVTGIAAPEDPWGAAGLDLPARCAEEDWLARSA